MSLNRFLKRMTGAIKGELGERNNPVCCDSPSGEQEYLTRLRGRSGKRPIFVRQGSAGVGPYGNILDIYSLSSPGMPDREIYMDMYHPGYVEMKPVPEYFIFNLGAGKKKIVPPSGQDSLAELTRFAQELGNAAEGDGPTLRQLLNSTHSAKTCADMIVFATSLVVFGYGQDREKVVDGLVRNPAFGLDHDSADKLYTFLVGE